MKTLSFLITALIVGATFYRVASRTALPANDEAEIKALEQRFAAAFTAKDVNAIMSVCVSDDSLVVFDLVASRGFVGARACKKGWESLFAAFPGPARCEISDLKVTADARVAFAQVTQHVILSDKSGKKFDATVRVTDGFRKTDGKWLIAHEHASVPVDLETGKASLSPSKP